MKKKIQPQKQCRIRGCENFVGRHPQYCEHHAEKLCRVSRPSIPGVGGGRRVTNITGEGSYGPDRFNPIQEDPHEGRQ